MRQDLFPNMGKNWKARVHSIRRKHTLFPLQGTRRGALNMQRPPPSPASRNMTWNPSGRELKGKTEVSPELVPSAHRNPIFIKLIQNIFVPCKDPSKGLPITCKAREGGTVAVMGSESYGFCGIMLISGPRWECARSQRAALNLPKMEQITTALLFNNGDAAWRLQIPASNAPKGARRSRCWGTVAPRWKTRPTSFWCLWTGPLILFFLLFFFIILSQTCQEFCSRKCLISYHLRGKGGLCYFYS